MDQLVVGVVPNHKDAMRVVHELMAAGFPEAAISVVARHDDAAQAQAGDADADPKTRSLQTAPVGPGGAGAATGGLLGGLGGLLVGLGALLIPGIGPIVAAGPLLGALGGAAAGAATGGLVGVLTTMGVPQEDVQVYHSRFEEGGVLVTVRTDADSAEDAAAVLRRYEPIPDTPGGGSSVRILPVAADAPA